MENPCESCVVKPMCSKVCEKKEQELQYIILTRKQYKRAWENSYFLIKRSYKKCYDEFQKEFERCRGEIHKINSRKKFDEDIGYPTFNSSSLYSSCVSGLKNFKIQYPLICKKNRNNK